MAEGAMRLKKYFANKKNKKYNMTNEEKLTKLQELESILKVHDFYFRMSDDHRWWEKGMSEEIKIDKLVNELGQEGQELRDKYNPFKKTIN